MSISTEGDIVEARIIAREAANQIGFGITDITRIVTAASELARNVFRYAGEGNMEWKIINDQRRKGIELVFSDNGPGIADVNQAMEEGFSTGIGLGLGLPGARKLMDEIQIESELNKGTKIIIRKWEKKMMDGL